MDRPRVLDYAGDPHIRPRMRRILFAVFGFMMPLFFVLGLSIELIAHYADTHAFPTSVSLLVKRVAESLLWAVVMFAVLYLPNRSRRWLLTDEALVILNGESERDVVPWESIQSVRIRRFGIVVDTQERKRHRLFGISRNEAEVVSHAWQDATGNGQDRAKTQKSLWRSNCVRRDGA